MIVCNHANYIFTANVLQFINAWSWTGQKWCRNNTQTVATILFSPFPSTPTTCGTRLDNAEGVKRRTQACPLTGANPVLVSHMGPVSTQRVCVMMLLSHPL